MDTPILQPLYARADRLMLIVLLILLMFACGLALVHDTWSLVFSVGLPVAAVPVALTFVAPGHFMTRLAFSVAFMLLSALHIHQCHGVIEVHFGIFVLLALLLYYRDWRVIVSGATIAAVHHLLFNSMQAQHSGVWLFNHDPSVPMVLVHAAYVVFESGFLIYMAINGAKEATRNYELQLISQHFETVSGKINLNYKDTTIHTRSEFAQGFKSFISAVNNVVKSTQQLVHGLTGATLQLRAVTNETKTDTQQEHNTTADIAASVESLTSAFKNVAASAKKAAQSAQQADELVSSGARVVSQTITTLDELASRVEQASEVIQLLESHTGSIGVVLDVIRDIADQTNLLALNAAIEAARAGEQGRGFAVVADEVRTLASRTQKSTEDIQRMIAELQNQSKNAVRVMREGRDQAHQAVTEASNTSAAFSSIAQSVNVITHLNFDIAKVGEQQRHVVDGIQQKVHHITSAALHTSQNVEQLEKLCQDLVNMTEQVQGLVDQFSV